MTCIRLALVLLALVSPIAAHAGGDLCLFDTDFGRVFVFTKPRIPKAIAAAPIAGQMFDSMVTAGAPVGGTVARQTLGRLNFGLTQSLVPCQMNINTNSAFEGTISYDCNFDGVYEIQADIAPGDCSQVL